MERVGLFLQRAAVDRRNTDEFDMFGRSSFNRYYYATFLVARALILEFEPQWQAVHADLPNYLKATVFREIDRFRKQSVRRQNDEAVRICNQAIAAVRSLATLLSNAYPVRIAADYQPEIPVTSPDGDRFSLANVSINAAHSWSNEARAYAAVIRRGWRLSRGL